VIALWNDWLKDWKDSDIVELTRLLAQLRNTLQQASDESVSA